MKDGKLFDFLSLESLIKWSMYSQMTQKIYSQLMDIYLLQLLYILFIKNQEDFTKTVNTVIANIECIIKFSNKKQENMLYQY